MGSDEQRGSFRVEARIEGELFHEGRVVPCEVENLSAGGAAVTTGLELEPGTQCTLGLRMDREQRAATGLDYLSFHMEVLEGTAQRGGDIHYRMRNLTSEGSDAYERAQKLVFDAQRRARAAETGSDEASPLASDRDRRTGLKRIRRPRFSRGSMRPGSD